MKKVIIVLALFSILVILLINQNFEDVQISKYESIEELKENKGIKNGWVPSIIPDSAFDIVESHDLDTSTIYGSFKYKEKDEELVIKNLVLSNGSEDTFTWGNFLFKVDKEKNLVKFRNK